MIVLGLFAFIVMAFNGYIMGRCVIQNIKRERKRA